MILLRMRGTIVKLSTVFIPFSLFTEFLNKDLIINNHVNNYRLNKDYCNVYKIDNYGIYRFTDLYT